MQGETVTAEEIKEDFTKRQNIVNEEAKRDR